MQNIPCDPTLADYEMRCRLGDDARAFWLRFRWKVREQGWFMDISDADRNLIRASLAVRLGAFIGSRMADSRRPAGLFLAVDTSGADADPGINDLGARVQLYFLTASDLGLA